jgi:hypothetical protein
LDNKIIYYTHSKLLKKYATNLAYFIIGIKIKKC